MNAPRTKRTATSREKDSRQQQWKPANLLPDPEPIDGINFHWVRESVMGEHDPMNMTRKMREGWEPCKASDHPEFAGMGNPAEDGMIRYGGLILCKRPLNMSQQQSEYYENMAQKQMQSVDNSFMSESDERMPLFKEGESKVKFGSGS